MDALKLLLLLLAYVGLLTISLLYYVDTPHQSQGLALPTFQGGVWGIIQLLARCIGVTFTLSSSTVDDRPTTTLALHVQVTIGEYLDMDWIVFTMAWRSPGLDIQIGGPSRPTAQTGSITLQVWVNAQFPVSSWEYFLVLSYSSWPVS